MKTALLCLTIVISAHLAFEIFAADTPANTGGSPPPRSTPTLSATASGYLAAVHPAITANVIALFRPWDGTVWLTIHQRGEPGWYPASVDILTDYKPIVKKVRSTTGGWEYKITFTSETAND